MQTSTRYLFRLGGISGAIGGALRIASSFIPYNKELVWLEGLYTIIDVCLLFGLMAIYFHYAERLHRAGLIAFVFTVIGIASIVGPDTVKFGINFYEIGAFLTMTGLLLLSIQMLRHKVLFWAPCLWLLSFVMATLALTFTHSVFFTGAGITFGMAFILSGGQLVKQQ